MAAYAAEIAAAKAEIAALRGQLAVALSGGPLSKLAEERAAKLAAEARLTELQVRILDGTWI